MASPYTAYTNHLVDPAAMMPLVSREHTVSAAAASVAMTAETRLMSDRELEQALALVEATCSAARATWDAVRAAGQTDTRCPEYRAINAAQRGFGPIFVEQGRRAHLRNLGMFAPAPMAGAPLPEDVPGAVTDIPPSYARG